MTELRKRQLAWVAGISALVAVLAVWTFAIDWEWSYIGDDAAWLQTVRSSATTGTALTPLLTSFSWSWGEAVGWGLFRPTSIAYYALIYQLDVSTAHLIRVVMYLVALAAPLLLMHSKTPVRSHKLFAVWLLALGLANYTMIYGIYFVSLSELTAIFLVALGLFMPKPALKILFFLLAALAKAPFIWLVFTYTVYLMLKTSTRRIGLIGFALSGLSLGAIVFASQSGHYGDNLTLNPWHFFKNVELLGTYGAPFLFILLIGIFLFVSHLRPDPMTWVLLISAFLFAGNMLAWNTIGYYNAPIWFLLTCALATALQGDSTSPKTVSTKWVAPIIAGCLIAATLLAAETFRTDVFGRNQMVTEGRDWILENLKAADSYFIYDFSNSEFHFYLTEKNPEWDREPPPQWKSGQPRPPETLNADYVVATNEVPLAPEITRCQPIKVWTRGFLAPMKC